MAIALASSGTPPHREARTCDTADLRVVHGLLRALFRDAPALARSVAADQPRRRAAVIAHLALLSSTLGGHHETEDELLWGDLERRAPGCAAHVGVLRGQHAEMAVQLAELDEALVAWERNGGADEGGVSGRLETIRRMLDRHLGDEERWVEPVASVTLSQREWDRLGERGGEHTPRGMEFVLLGFLIWSLPADARDAWTRVNLPAPVRLLWRLVGRRAFDRHRAGLAVDA